MVHLVDIPLPSWFGSAAQAAHCRTSIAWGLHSTSLSTLENLAHGKHTLEPFSHTSLIETLSWLTNQQWSTFSYIFNFSIIYPISMNVLSIKGLNFLSNKLERTTLFTKSSYSHIPIAQITLQQARASHPFRSAISLFFSCTMRLWCMRWKSRSFWVFSRSSLALLKKHHHQQPSRQLLFIS